MNISAPALRPYLEMIEKQCRALDRENLIQLILTMAKQVDSGKRTDFLDNFQSHLPTAKKEKSADTAHPAQLQEELEELRESVRTRIISIEDGSYWDDPDEEDWDSYHLDTEPEPLNHAQIAAFIDFFDEADHQFLHGDKTMAKMIYKELFAIIAEIEDYDFSIDLEINLREERARLARCEYELSSGEDRLEVMLSTMGANPSENDLSVFSLQKLPLLQDVRDAETADLIHQLLEDYGGGNTIFFDSYNPRLIEENSSGAKEIRQGLRLVDKTTIDLDSYRKWSGTIGEQRINDIVSNTHRSA